MPLQHYLEQVSPGCITNPHHSAPSKSRIVAANHTFLLSTELQKTRERKQPASQGLKQLITVQGQLVETDWNPKRWIQERLQNTLSKRQATRAAVDAALEWLNAGPKAAAKQARVSAAALRVAHSVASSSSSTLETRVANKASSTTPGTYIGESQLSVQWCKIRRVQWTRWWHMNVPNSHHKRTPHKAFPFFR